MWPTSGPIFGRISPTIWFIWLSTYSSSTKYSVHPDCVTTNCYNENFTSFSRQQQIRIKSICRSYCQYYICSDFYKIIKSCLQININKPEDSSLSFFSLSIKCFKNKTMNKQVIQVNWNTSISQLFTVRSKIDNSLIMNHRHKVSHWTT